MKALLCRPRILPQAASFSSVSFLLDPCIGRSASDADLYHQARAFADKELRPHAVQWDEEYHFPAEQVKKAAGLGYLGMFVSRDYGGQALSRARSLLIIEALATGCVGTASMICVHNMCAGMLDRFGSTSQKDAWLPQLTAYERMASYCITEPGSGSDAASLTTSAVKEDEHYVVSGSKAFISGAGLSDQYLVMCRAPAGITCLVLDKSLKGIEFGKNEKKMGLRCTPTRQIMFDQVQVPAAQRLGDEGQGFKIAMSGLDGGRLSIGASSLGAAQGCLEITLRHLKGSSVGQADQFALADMASQVTIARQQLHEAAGLLDSRHAAAINRCALAKKVATEVGFGVCNQALQLLEGNGGSDEDKRTVQMFVRGTRVHSIVEGTNEIMRHLVGKSIVAQR